VSNRSYVLVPCRDIVTEPVTYIGAGAHESTASDDHCTFSGPSLKHRVLASSAHHCAVSDRMCQSGSNMKWARHLQIVSIVLGPPTFMDNVSVRGLVAEYSGSVVDLV
jgi:hypothetical protein